MRTLKDQTPLELLQNYWGHDSFRGSQESIIQTVREGRDVLALLPTGGGKSICYQIPALCQEGIAIVVSPLVALMQDQVEKLRALNVKAMALTGALHRDEVVQYLDNAAFGNYKLLYISPERLQQDMVLKRLGQLNVSLIAIDEAHCISQWGHDFRPAYLNCARLRDIHPEVPVIALTATATQSVIKEIIDALSLEVDKVVKDSFERPNLTYSVLHNHNKQKALIDLIQNTPGSIIVYVRTRRETEQLAQLLNTNNLSAVYYHAGRSQSVKKAEMQKWLQDSSRIMVATTAFGMGIDKPDVRAVIHYAIPESLESYFQEAGRAGRDGSDARATLLISPSDTTRARKQFTDNLPTLSDLKELYRHLVNHFQIAHGEGSGQTFPFDFSAFCNRYKIPQIRVHRALMILDQLGILALDQNVHRQSTIKYTADRESFWNYLNTQPAHRAFHETLIRSYGGVFDNHVALNTTLLARRLGSTEAEILNHLKKAQKDQIAEVQIQETDMNITFLVPREDDKALLRHKEVILQNRRRKVENLEHMLRYTGNDRTCRSIQLLAYFGERKSMPCGACDVCLSNRSPSASKLKGQKDKIIAMLQDRVMTLSDINIALREDKRETLQCVQELLEDEKIAVNEQNQYYKK